jgi:hypothetical protein
VKLARPPAISFLRQRFDAMRIADDDAIGAAELFHTEHSCSNLRIWCFTERFKWTVWRKASDLP